MTRPTFHDLTPPAELVREWHDLWFAGPSAGSHHDLVATLAARWGAEQGANRELEEVCGWIRNQVIHITNDDFIDKLHAARRPKPLSLKEQALKLLPEINGEEVIHLCPLEVAKIRRALEAQS